MIISLVLSKYNYYYSFDLIYLLNFILGNRKDSSIFITLILLLLIYIINKIKKKEIQCKKLEKANFFEYFNKLIR